MDNVKIGVVIPFYQRESGILIKAVNSILKQNAKGIFYEIIIVDDESPISAKIELLSLVKKGDNYNINIIVQSNGGPGAARNTGLLFLEQRKTAISYCAFLDSDDIWLPGHIKKAVCALSGSDFYFCDHKRIHNEISYFSEKVKDIDNLKGKSILSSKDFFVIDSNCYFNATIFNYLSQTSTIVFKLSKLNNLRFNTELRLAGEDQFFFLQIATQLSFVSFSHDCNVILGEGINIWHSSLDWSKKEACESSLYVHLFYRNIKSKFILNKLQSNFINTQCKKYREFYSYLFIKHLLKGNFSFRYILSFFKKINYHDLLLIPFYSLSLFMRKILKV